MIVDISIEFGHLYTEQINEAIKNGNLKKSIEMARMLSQILALQGKSFSLAVLIDDYNNNLIQVDHNEIMDIYKKMGLTPDYIVFESKLANSAEYLLSCLPDKFLVKESNSLIYRSQSADSHFSELLQDGRRFKAIFMDRLKSGADATVRNRKSYLSLQERRCHSNAEIVLLYNQNNQVRYGCPVLAACWYLARLGVEPFYSDLKIENREFRPFIGKHLLTILPVDYMKVEATVHELISLCKTKAIKKCKKRMDYFFT